MEKIKTVICEECGNEMQYVVGRRHKLGSGGIPEAVSCPDGCLVAWDGVMKCSKCGKKINVSF